ncbi:MAG: YraN family protein [Candidatus Krumholzibacteria bacterium]|nr:YraN family protein [Candidatus Krumholzibacteria bacterium]
MDGKAACGRAGERIACAWLELIGCRVVGRNRRAGRGEIDIIALDGSCLVFVEVKTRRSGRFGGGAEAVDRRKLQSMRRTAALMLASGGTDDGVREFRFDVITVDVEGAGAGLRLRHLRGVC